MKRLVVLAAALMLAACADVHGSAPSATSAAAPAAVQPSAEMRDTQERLRAYGLYDGPIDGLWGPETQAAVERFQRNHGLAVTQRLDPPTLNAIRGANAAAPSIAGGNPLEPGVVRGVQRRLRQLGFYSGRIDGVWGERTYVSLERFQRSRGLEATGRLTPETASALGLDPNNLSASAASLSR